MAIGSLYEVTARQRYMGRDCANVYFFTEVSAWIANASEVNAAHGVARAFQADYLSVIRTMQNADVLYTAIEVRDLFIPANQYNLLVSLNGLFGSGTDQLLPVFCAADFEMNIFNADIRKGRKRIAGLTESCQIDGVITDSTFIGYCNDTANIFEQPIAQVGVTETGEWDHVVVKRIRSGTPGNYEYRLPETLTEAEFSVVIEAFFDPTITSQVSRKGGGSF